MKSIKTILVVIGLLSISCSKVDPETDCIKGKLLINGICGNITIQVMSGNIDSNLIVKSWTDPATDKTHQNVFALRSICTFPSSIKEGDEFYFNIDNDPKGSDCAVCLAYRPVPPKGLMIKVCQ
jgi:hypothetical protein